MAETIVEFAAQFSRDLERLDEKYPGALEEVEKLVEQLKRGERPGDRVKGLGYSVYKVRLRNPAAKRGKSGGFRTHYYVQFADRVVMMTFYSKTRQADIPANKLKRIIEEIEK